MSERLRRDVVERWRGQAAMEHLAECPAFPHPQVPRKLGACKCGKAEERARLADWERLRGLIAAFSGRVVDQRDADLLAEAAAVREEKRR